MSSGAQNGQDLNGQGKIDLGVDVAQLSSLLSQESAEGDADVAELLRRIDTAESMAQGVETKLDNMLENLDTLLASLESRTDAYHVGEKGTTQRDKKSGR